MDGRKPDVCVEVPWGTGTTPVAIDPSRLAGVLGARVGVAADPDRAVREAVRGPESSIKEFLAGAPSPLVVVVNDATRPTPSAGVLRVVRHDLEEWLETPGHDLFFTIATGTHRAALPEEVDHIFGTELATTHSRRIFCHDSRDDKDLVRVGRTRRGTEVWVNRLVVEARSLLLVNSVEPHYFAGYTGGRKSLCPGLAGYVTVRANHSLCMEPGSENLVLTGNPVHEDLEEATAMGLAGKAVFSIQLVLDRDHRAGFAAAGTMEESFRMAVAVAEKQFVLDIDRRYEIVVAAAPHPMDCNFFQANKAIQSGALAVKDRGVLVLVSQCPFGLGENLILFETLAAADSPAQARERVDLEEYRLGVHQATRLASILERTQIWVVSSLPYDDVRAMFMTPFADVQSAVDSALVEQGPEAQVLFLPEASITVPRVRGAR